MARASRQVIPDRGSRKCRQLCTHAILIALFAFEVAVLCMCVPIDEADGQERDVSDRQFQLYNRCCAAIDLVTLLLLTLFPVEKSGRSRFPPGQESTMSP